MNIKFLYGTNTELENVSKVAGQLLFTTDSPYHVHFDLSSTQRIDLYSTDFSELKTLIGNESVATQITKAINTLKTDVIGTPDASKTIVAMIKELDQKIAEADLSTVIAQVDANKKAIETLNGNDTKDGSVDKKIKDAITTLSASLASLYDPAGAADAVKGNSTSDTSASETVFGFLS